MGPEELQQLIDFEPFVPFRLTLSSGDVVHVRQKRRRECHWPHDVDRLSGDQR